MWRTEWVINTDVWTQLKGKCPIDIYLQRHISRSNCYLKCKRALAVIAVLSLSWLNHINSGNQLKLNTHICSEVSHQTQRKKSSAGCVRAITRSSQRRSYSQTTHTQNLRERSVWKINRHLRAWTLLRHFSLLQSDLGLYLVWKPFSKVYLVYVSLDRELWLRHQHWSIWGLLAALLHIKHTFPKRLCGYFNRALNLKFNLLAIFIISFYMIYFLKEPVKNLYWAKVHLEFVDVKSLQRKICKQKI